MEFDRREILNRGLMLGLAAPLASCKQLGNHGGASLEVTAERRASLMSIADAIIPMTATAGASRAGVIDFVTLMVRDWMTQDEAQRFLHGHDAFEQTARRSGKAFAKRAPADQVAFVEEQEGKARASMNKPDSHAPFIVWMKRLTVYGYYTSEAGASQELDLNLVPGEYQACSMIDKGMPAFSLDRYVPVFTVDNNQPVIQ